jgi:hypothetical protein
MKGAIERCRSFDFDYGGESSPRLRQNPPPAIIEIEAPAPFGRTAIIEIEAPAPFGMALLP